jgi:hypothetical protein
VEVEQPRDESWRYLVGRNTFGIKYEICVSIGTPRICWLAGPWMGAASDPTIAMQSNIKTMMLPNEALLADKIYRGDRLHFIVPLTGHRYALDQEERAYNYLVYSVRQSVERVIDRLTNFGIFHQIWRYSFELHQICTRVCAKLVNLFLNFEPL